MSTSGMIMVGAADSLAEAIENASSVTITPQSPLRLLAPESYTGPIGLRVVRRISASTVPRFAPTGYPPGFPTLYNQQLCDGRTTHVYEWQDVRRNVLREIHWKTGHCLSLQ